MSFIDASYFIGELTIPNSGDQAISERIQYFINKYEPLFLQKLLGYSLYKAFMTGMSVTAPATPDPRFLSILYGSEYLDYQGNLQKWKGIIVTDMPLVNSAGDLIYKKPVYMNADITVGLNAGTNTATFDGTDGTDDWRGWTPIITRDAVMIPGVDYSWNIDTGQFTLLKAGDVFNPVEYFFTQFELRTDIVTAPEGASQNESCIANFVYYWYYRSVATQSTGFGELQTNGENAVNMSPRHKMISAWNEMSTWVQELMAFLEQSAANYPEWKNINECDALKYFGFSNPFF